MAAIWAGIDAGKTHHHCVAIDESGRRLLSRRVANDEPELLELLADVLALGDGETQSREPGFDATSISITTLQQWFTCVRLPAPHLTPLGRLLHIAHHDHVTALAACGGLKPPPAGRLRRARPSCLAQHCFQNCSY
ncbi:IS110 family transposase, partial [Streptomyces sp. NPDC002346]